MLSFSNVRSPVQIKEFSVFAGIIAGTVMLIISLFTWKVYTNQIDKVMSRLEADSGRIERTFTDTIDHTSYIMAMMIQQIKPNYGDLNYINNLLTNYRTNPNISNVLSWTIFSWTDAKHRIVVDALYGILDTPIDLTSRDYIPSTVNNPGKIELGDPVEGSTSHRWMIPGGIGAVDTNGRYIGALTIGFDINALTDKLRNVVKTEGVDFAIINKDLNIVLRSSDKLPELGTKDHTIPEGALRNLLKEANVASGGTKSFSRIYIFSDKDSFYFYKLTQYPYILYLKYNKKLIKQEVWHALASRAIEVILLGAVCVIVLIAVYKRESRLRREAEDAHRVALQASKAKSEFLAYTSHELRSPLNMVILGSEMMMSQVFGELSEKYISYAKDIHQNGKDLLEFIEDLLDETKIEEEQFTLQLATFDIPDIVRRAINLNITRAQKHNIHIKTDIVPDMPLLYADPRRLRQILNNLISNSIKYSPEGTTVTISAYVDADRICLQVKDEGFGMTEKELKVALSKYGTITNKNTGKVESIGLGLPLVKALVEGQGAEFKIESEPEKGTTVTIVFKQENTVYQTDSRYEMYRKQSTSGYESMNI